MGYPYQNANYGDYYRGDPFLGGLFKAVGKGISTVAGVASKVLPGPFGTVAGAVSNITGGGGRGAPPASPRITGPLNAVANIQQRALQGTQIPAIPVPGVKGTIQRLLPGGESGYMSAGTPSGYHWNKSGYWTSEGYVAKGTKLVRNRSQNPANVRALRRAIRRESSFIKIARRTGLVALPQATRTRKKASRRRR